jgi:hypothetical protein
MKFVAKVLLTGEAERFLNKRFGGAFRRFPGALVPAMYIVRNSRVKDGQWKNLSGR